MKENKLRNTQILVTVISILLGSLLHFVCQWSGENVIIASFSAVNESVWEHLKLAFFPMTVMAIIEYFLVRKEANNYIEAKMIGIFSAISFIIVFFFTYTGILGTNFLVIDILTFIVSIILGEIIAYKIMMRENESTIKTKILSGLVLLFLLISFIIATYFPPKVNLFQDPSNGKYGIESTE